MHILWESEAYSAYRFGHLGWHLLEPWGLYDIPVHCLLNFALATAFFRFISSWGYYNRPSVTVLGSSWTTLLLFIHSSMCTILHENDVFKVIHAVEIVSLWNPSAYHNTVVLWQNRFGFHLQVCLKRKKVPVMKMASKLHLTVTFSRCKGGFWIVWGFSPAVIDSWVLICLFWQKLTSHPTECSIAN